jgi:cysteine desulfurase
MKTDRKQSEIYLDYNATTPIAPEVARAMMPIIEEEFGNPSSGYNLGQKAKEKLEEAREDVANLIGCKSSEILFTSGGSESNNMAIKGISYVLKERGNHVITSSIEHPAVLNTCRFLMKNGFDVTFLPVDSYGRVDPESVEKAVRKTTVLISIMHANNETGTLQPVEEIGRIANERGIPFHTDAAQSVGKIPVRVDEMRCDLLSIAGHKLYAPKGVGALYIRDGLTIEPLIHGAGQEGGRRAGTENVLLDVALGTACRVAGERMHREVERIRDLRDRLHEKIANSVDNLVLNGHPDDRLPNTLNVSLPGIDSGKLLGAIPALCASTGAACHDRSVEMSHVLAAMGVSEEVGMGALRLTLGRGTTGYDIDRTAELICSARDEIVRQRA